MLKFIKHNMDTIAGIDIYPVISFIIFFLFFVALFVWVAKMKKSEVTMLSALPFEEDENESTNNITTESKKP